jgi:hypothetical protein
MGEGFYGSPPSHMLPLVATGIFGATTFREILEPTTPMSMAQRSTTEAHTIGLITSASPVSVLYITLISWDSFLKKPKEP